MTSTVSASSSAERTPGRRTGARAALVQARATLRLTGLALWTGAGFALWLVARGLLLPAPGAYRAVRRVLFRHWSRGVCRLLAVRTRVIGGVPRAPFFLVSNHLSYLDIVVLAAQAPCRFVAKREVRGWPGVGPLARTMGTIFVDRGAPRDAVRALNQVEAAIRGGDGVTVFAEATSSAGAGVLPFRSALLEWAARTRHPVHYATLGYRTPPGSAPAHLSVCWWGDMTFGRHLVGLAGLRSCEATIHFGPDPITAPDRRQLADRLHAAVRAQFVPVLTLE